MRFIIEGNTYPYKELFKQHGARWSPDVKVWEVQTLGALENIHRSLSQYYKIDSRILVVDRTKAILTVGPKEMYPSGTKQQQPMGNILWSPCRTSPSRCTPYYCEYCCGEGLSKKGSLTGTAAIKNDSFYGTGV